MKNEKIKIVEEPILNLKVEVDRSVNGNHEARMNWPSFTLIDLVEVFQTPIPNNDKSVSLEVAEHKAKQFKKRLKAYIIEKADQSELENFDWSEWEIV
tara:strand:+ start:50 stop:343 length:294 start_codon:yes stop_codon:yes gene_type:complete